MRTLFVSDIHFGLSRQANHTQESSLRREAAAREALSDIYYGVLKKDLVVAVCAGDFFDKFSNPETTIIQAIPYANSFDYILAGNHDHSQRADTYSSLDLLAETLDSRVSVITAPQSDPMRSLWFVPHCLTQDQFVEALEKARLDASLQSCPGILVTHCNYAMPFELSSSSLNMTREMAEHLLGVFDYVLLGHEHTPKEDFDGRLIVIGSHFPTSFSDLTDKRHLIYDSATGVMSSVTHWRAAEHVYVGPGCDAPPGMQYYDLSDCDDPKLPVHLFKAGAFGVRVPSASSSTPLEYHAAPLADLKARIREELADQPDLLSLFNSLLEEQNAE
jgi:predicted phosphodiesterase